MKAAKTSKWQEWKATEDPVGELCQAIINGQSMTAFAQSVGASKATLSEWIAADTERSARTREARIQSASTFDDLALKRIDEASDPFELAKAKEAAHHMRWRASKIAPKDYGDKVQHGGSEDLPAIGITVIERRIVKAAD